MRKRHSSALGTAVSLLALGLGASAPVQAQSAAQLTNTKHNLSVSGPGPTRALSETRICVFCHTPHNAAPQSPLWNRELQAQVYSVYASPTLKAGPLPQPSGPTKLCLSCHDGTIAMGAVLNPVGQIRMAGNGRLPTGSLADFGVDLTGHHPVSFSYRAALPNADLAPSPPADLPFGGTDEVHCITCHDPHNDQFGKFLLADNRYSALCLKCHQISGWAGSVHATSAASVAGILPRSPKTWPTWTQLGEWGCETCHTPHFAPTAPQLLNFTAAPPAFTCTTTGCHGGASPPFHPGALRTGAATLGDASRVGRTDIAHQVQKSSAHHEQPGVIQAMPNGAYGAARSGIRAVGCADCHNPHLANDRRSEAPYVSGLLQGVGGVDRDGVEIREARYEYEVCLKCHGDNAPDLDFVPRVAGSTNLRRALATSNASYHPVLGVGRELDVPSIPSPLNPALSPTSTIYCTSCHTDDEGSSNGPHGSAFAPILRERYETADNTLESYQNYALFYRCHDRSSILSDVSFRKKTSARTTSSGGGHSGHLAAGVTCSACHDAHGVDSASAPAATGSHAHLINFDRQVVLPNAGSAYPVFNPTGRFSANCTLTCHGVVHDRTSYP